MSDLKRSRPRAIAAGWSAGTDLLEGLGSSIGAKPRGARARTRVSADDFRRRFDPLLDIRGSPWVFLPFRGGVAGACG
jgi:hypothetical protein